jgi:drug/metabolite transporter (DMT)-like permease
MTDTSRLPPAIGQRLLRGAALMIAASAVVAGTTLIAKALGRGFGGEPLHPVQIVAGRFVFAFVCVAAVAAWQRPSLKGAPWGFHAARSLVGWAGVTCVFTAATLMPLAEATAISFLSPLVTMALAMLFLRERIGRWRVAAAAIAVAGAMILIQPGTEAFRLAALVALAAAFFQGTEGMMIKRLAGMEPTLRILLVNNGFGAIIAVAAVVFVWQPLTAAQWGALAVLGSIMILAQVLFLLAMKVADASYVIPFFYSTLVFAAAYDFAVFSEAPGLATWLGGGLIVAGAILLAWREGVRRRGTG